MRADRIDMTYEDRIERMREYSDEPTTKADEKWMRERAFRQDQEQSRENAEYERLMRGGR
jgi:hypothetical protein